LKAEAIYDAYLEEGKRIKSAGVAGAKLDFAFFSSCGNGRVESIRASV
jgi:homoaconitase/3-isopropylmalate dehydratase large subunit